MNLRYRFVLASGEEKVFELALDGETLSLAGKPGRALPEWTRLDNEQCPNCPLKAATTPRCPVAANLVDVIEGFKDGISFHEAEITITAPAREYRKRAPLQTGISSLIGVVMVTSGCPVLDRLRPMVCTHLPFAEVNETMYRAISMYLLAQYFLHKRGRAPDWELKDLVKIYDEISTVNRHFAKRLKTIQIEDATLNALVSLDCFANISVCSIMDDSLSQLENLFHAYLRG
ncbi:MAG: hypothetical protein HY554_13345 [Elusimicrobia bacterium]|nr:hypothetical protein [Elusimicrobiota bacterium]